MKKNSQKDDSVSHGYEKILPVSYNQKTFNQKIAKMNVNSE